MSMPVLLKTKPIDSEYKRRYGNVLTLTEEKAYRLQKKGKVKIIEPIDGKKKLVEYKSNKKKKNQEKKYLNIDLRGARIPYLPNEQIGKCYNEMMINEVQDWVVFIDHDVFLVNPLWYDICCNAIEKIGYKAGWISCYTNRIGCRLQRAPGIDTRSDDIIYHRRYAREIYLRNKGNIKECTFFKGQFSGMFILTHRKAWEEIGGFNEDTFFKVDNKYYAELKKHGYHTYIMEDLYVYHGYFRETLNPYFTKG